ncbi:hypothetical protein Tco_0493298 [Tanacetum coccineum]
MHFGAKMKKSVFCLEEGYIVLRRWGSIFTSVYAAVQKLKKDSYKALMNELVNDGIKLLKLEINTGFINGLPKKWLSFCQSPRNTNHMKDFELASLFGKLKYEETLIDSIYENEKRKSLVSVTPLSTAFLTTFIVQDFQDSPDDEEDTRSSHEYLNDLEEECQARALLAKSKRDCWSKTSVPSYQSPFQPNLLHSSEYKPKPRLTKSFEAKYDKVKAKLAILSSSASVPSSSSGKNKGLIAEMYDWDEEEVSSDDNEVSEVKALMALTDEERVFVGKESANNGEWVRISIQKNKETIFFQNRNLFHELNTCKEQLLVLKQAKLDLLTMHHVLKENQNLRNELKELTSITEAWLNTDESLVCSTPLPPLEKLISITINEPFLAPARGNKSSSVSKTNSANAGKLKNVEIEDDPPLAIVRKELNELKLQISKNKSSYFRNKNSQQVPSNALQNKYKTQFKMNYELCGQKNHLSENCYEVLFCKKCKRTNHRTCDHTDFMSSMDINQYHTSQSEPSSRSRPSKPAMPFPSCFMHTLWMIISLRRGIKPRNPQHITKNCEKCGSNVHTTSDHNDIKWFRKREALQAKKAESFKASKTKS